MSLRWTTGILLVLILAVASCAENHQRRSEPSMAAEDHRRRYEAPMVAEAIAVDGVMDDPTWAAAPWTEAYIVYGTLGETPATRTRAKMAWDAENLYLGIEAADQDIWSTYTKRDDRLWNEDVLEFFIDPEGDAEGYLEFEVSPRNTVYDSHVVKPLFSQGGPADPDWHATGLRTAVQVNGTLGGGRMRADERRDTDVGWVMEVALPWKACAIVSGRMALPPRPGDTWRINLMRYDYSARREMSQWSPSVVKGAWHEPKEYGYVTFAASSE